MYQEIVIIRKEVQGEVEEIEVIPADDKEKMEEVEADLVNQEVESRKGSQKASFFVMKN